MINIDELTLGQLKQIAAQFGPKTAEPTKIKGDLRPVIVRARDAGVHYGLLESYSGRTVILRESRRLWSWTAKAGIALSGVAVHGIDASKSKIDSLVAEIAILDACEIIDCSTIAAKTIMEAK